MLSTCHIMILGLDVFIYISIVPAFTFYRPCAPPLSFLFRPLISRSYDSHYSCTILAPVCFLFGYKFIINCLELVRSIWPACYLANSLITISHSLFHSLSHFADYSLNEPGMFAIDFYSLATNYCTTMIYHLIILLSSNLPFSTLYHFLWQNQQILSLSHPNLSYQNLCDFDLKLATLFFLPTFLFFHVPFISHPSSFCLNWILGFANS